MSNLLFDIGSNKQLQGQLQTYSLGAGLKFDGVNDYVQHSALDLGLINSFSCIFSIDSTKPFHFVLNTTADATYMFGLTPTSFLINLSGGTFFVTVPFTFVINRLYHVILTRNNNNFVLYIKSEVDDFQSSFLYPTVSSKFSLICGDVFYGNIFNGNITMFDLKLFDKTLTGLEVTKLYETKGMILPPTILPSQLVANYTFNQKQGTTLIDSSPNGNNGTLINFSNTTPSIGNAWVDDLGNSILT